MSVGGDERVDAATRVGDVHDAVDDDGCCLVADTIDHAMLKEPSGRQRMDVGPVDLVHLGIAATREV